MKLQNPIRTVLILIAALMVSGCALKPRAASRFHHPVSSDGTCNCYTCQNAPSAVAQHAAAAPCTSCNSLPAGEAVVESQAPQPFTAPAISAGSDSKNVESFNSIAPLQEKSREQDDFPIVEEITPNLGSSTRSGSNTKPSVDPLNTGGAFKTFDSSEAIVVAPSEPEPAMIEAPVADLEEAVEEKGFGQLEMMEPATEDTAPAIANTLEEAAKDVADEAPSATIDMKEIFSQAAEPVEAAPVEIPTSAESLISQPPAPTQTIELPKPANTFKPGQPFRPRKRTSVSPNDSTWNDLDTNFYQHGADEGVATEATTSTDSELASFFDSKDDDVPSRVPMPRPVGEGRVVLRADKVDQNVVYTPPAKSASMVVVPPLSQNFRTEDESGNWLRQDEHVIAALPPQKSHRVYEVTESARIADNSVAVKPESDPIFETLRQRSTVRLKAIPLARSINRQPAVLPVAQSNISQPVTQRPIVNTPALPPVTIEETAEEPVRVASPPRQEPNRPYTARSTDDDGLAVPPWRMK